MNYKDYKFWLIRRYDDGFIDDELRLFLNKQLAKIKGLQAIEQQKWQH